MSVSAQPRRVPMSREQFLQLPEGPPYYDFELKNAPKNTPHHPRHRNTLFLPPSPSPMRWARGAAREPIWSAEASASASGGSFASALHNSPARPAGAEAVQVSGVLQRSFSVGGSFASALHNPPRGACPFTHMLGKQPPCFKASAPNRCTLHRQSASGRGTALYSQTPKKFRILRRQLSRNRAQSVV
jgi:hypothetical protein